ncbi:MULTISPECIES: molybdate ABC transporter substrate-binding protein [Nostocales]|uniref:Solute-binding protein n=3 Tax=Nostocales TaxID=1161 RepID=A0A8S9TBH5_9CYAN|nr:substrate-binding domain-containing protein [Tolypothrix bouteillei]KAF3889911.1 solute-binding protein [Tolypothrix bouteillei VB521301]
MLRQSLHQKHILNIAFMIVTITLTVFVGNLSNLSQSSAQQPNTVALTVSAGAGLKPVLEEIQKAYTHKPPNFKINYNFAASGVLTRQIEQGAKIDIFISASSENMNELKGQGLLPKNWV